MVSSPDQLRQTFALHLHDENVGANIANVAEYAKKNN